MSSNNNETIDFVITWVDGGDIEWQKERNKYAGKDPEDLADYRYRDWDLLRYWFRGVEKFAPWVNKVYFVTNGQKPEWLNLDCEKLVWAKHEDFIPKEYLPTFNSHTIEHNLYRIKDLSEKFVYFNDDMFVIKNINPTDYFLNDKPRLKPCFEAINIPNEMYEHIVLNDIQLINRYFDSKNVIKNNKKWISFNNSLTTNIKNLLLSRYHRIVGFDIPHLANPFLKSTMKAVWNIENEILNNTCTSKFRSKEQVSQNIYYWFNLAKGNFLPIEKNIGICHDIKDDDEELLDIITKQKFKMLCLNDSVQINDFEKVKSDLIQAFESILPSKCSFEK